MCFTNVKRTTDYLRSQTCAIKVFKLLGEDGKSPYRSYQWYYGWNHPQRKARKTPLKNYQDAGNGLYVFRRMARAELDRSRYYDEYVAVCWVLPEDIIGANSDNILARRVWLGGNPPPHKVR